MAIKKQYDFVVLGAGVAGLSFAWRMSRKGKRVLVLEKDSVVGGLSRTINYKGFLLDYCAHRFHTNNPSLLKTILGLKYVTMKKYQKKTRIYMFGKYLKYPFELPNLLRAMPLSQAFFSGIDFLLNLIRQKIYPTKVISYKDWFIRLYGYALYRVMCEPYTTKIWKKDPSTISADWAEARFGGPNLVALMKKSFEKLATLNFSGYDLSDDALAPDGGDFYYPDEGIGKLPEAFAQEASENGTSIKTSTKVTSINRENHTLEFEYKGKHTTVSYKALISTIPPISLYSLIGEKRKTLDQAFSLNQYMDMIFVYVFIDKAHVSSDHWLYFPDTHIPFNRAVEFGNWSKKMVLKGKTCICLDISCYKDDSIWEKRDTDLAQECIDAADTIGYFKKEDVIDVYVLRVPFAYPVYDLEYKERLKTIVSFLEKDDVYLLGRTGVFRYNNSDNSIEMAFQLGENFLRDVKDKSIFEYKIKQVSL